MFKKNKIAIVVSALLASSMVYAENTSVEPEERMLVTGQKSDYRVSSNTGSMRMEMTALETPGQVTVLDSQLIDEQRASTLGQVLKNDASVSTGSLNNNFERFSLRGFDLSTSSGYLRDGKQHFSYYLQPIELLESVEVLKGPAGLLYGKSAPGGLINMISKKPTAETQVVFSQDIGSENESRSTVDISGSLNEAETLRSRLVLSQQNSESSRHYSDGSSPTADRFVGGLFVEYDVNDKITVSAHYDRTEDDTGADSGTYIVDGESILGDDYIWDAQWANVDIEVENIGFGVDAQLSDNWSVNASFNHQDYNRNDLESYPDETTYDSNTGTYSHASYGSDRYDNWVLNTASIDLVGEFSTAGFEHKLLIGTNWLGYSYDQTKHTLTSFETTVGEPAASPVVSTSSSYSSEHDQYGIYIQDMLTINDQWQALAGLRYSLQVTPGDAGESDEKLDAITPKLALIYHPAKNGSIYLTYSESFEPQSDVSDSGATNFGDSLDPVTGKLYELGSKWELFDERLFVSGALFEITQENSTMDSYNSDGSAYEVAQIGERVHRGAELAMQGSVSRDLSLSASATYLDAEYTSDEDYQGNRPADVPEFSATLWSRYQVTEDTDINLGAIYVGSRYSDKENTYKKDGYTRFDFGVAHHLQYDQNLEMVFRLNVENIFDTDYLAGGGTTKGDYDTYGAQNVVVGEGRNFLASVQVRY